MSFEAWWGPFNKEFVEPFYDSRNTKDAIRVSCDRAFEAGAKAPPVITPWGSHQVVTSGHGYKVKVIIVTPGHRFSLQMHHHRDEIWNVVAGTGKVDNGEDEGTIVTVGDGIVLKALGKHRLENIGKIPLIIIETQIGTYLEEDDIVRFFDDYGRV